MMRIVGVSVLILGVLSAFGACKGDDTGGDGTGGIGSGGVGTGATGGMPPAGGMSGGTMGGSGMMGGSAIAGCEVADTSARPAALHAAALEALAAEPPSSSCGFRSCHQGSVPRAMLLLLGVTDLNMALVGRPSCEIPTISLVDDSGSNEGLAKSWLWIKLTHPADANTNLVTDPAWGTPGNCGQSTPGTFGQRMPQGSDMNTYLGDSSLAKIRNWICGSAPGP